MLIKGLNKTTLLDYPQHVACTVFMGGCNLRCPFCHNRDLVLLENDEGSSYSISPEELYAFLSKRKGILTGVCITGGEPTLQPELPQLLTQIKDLGFLIKLDTNGFRPQVLSQLIEAQLLDYVAIDIKNSPEKYPLTTGVSSCDLALLQASIDCLLSHADSLSFEFRTTVVDELHTLEDLSGIAHWIHNAPAYFLQPFQNSENTICSGFHTPAAATMYSYLEECQKILPNTKLRGMD